MRLITVVFLKYVGIFKQLICKTCSGFKKLLNESMSLCHSFNRLSWTFDNRSENSSHDAAFTGYYAMSSVHVAFA